jgi:hypothetical protein
VPENQKKLKWGKTARGFHISPMCKDTTAWRIEIISDTFPDLADLTNRAKCCVKRFWDFGATDGETLGLAADKRHDTLKSGISYRTAT